MSTLGQYHDDPLWFMSENLIINHFTTKLVFVLDYPIKKNQ